MKKTNLQVSFDADKLSALGFYMAKKEMSIEEELLVQLDRLYEKMVPVQVREYVESQFEGETLKQEIKPDDNAFKQEAKADEEKLSDKQPRQSKRQREKELTAEGQTEVQPEQATGPEEAEEENQGMTISM